MAPQNDHVSIVPEIEPHTEPATSEQPQAQRGPAPVPPTSKPGLQKPQRDGQLSGKQVAQMTGGEQETATNRALGQAEGIDETSKS